MTSSIDRDGQTVASAAEAPSLEPPLAKSSPDPAVSRMRRRLTVNSGLDRFSGLYVLAGVIVLFGVWVPNLFLTALNLRVILGGQAVTAIAAFAVLVPLACGTFDLSVAGTLGASLMIVLELQSRGINPVIAVLVSLAFGALIGAINGVVVIRFKVDSFVATLGMSSVLTAVAYWVSGGFEITQGISSSFVRVANAQWLTIPAPVYYMVIIGLILWVFLDLRPTGRSLYAVGGNARAARLAGIRVDRLVLLSLVVSGFLAALAGVLLASLLGSGNPTVGPPYLLPAFTAVFLGATQIKRGRVNVPGTVIAIYLLATGVKGLQLVGAPSYINDLFNGIALILAVALAVRFRKAT